MYGLLIYAAWYVIRFVVQWTSWGLFEGWRWVVGRMITPKGHVRAGVYQESKGFIELTNGGYTVRADFRADAVSRIKTK